MMYYLASGRFVCDLHDATPTLDVVAYIRHELETSMYIELVPTKGAVTVILMESPPTPRELPPSDAPPPPPGLPPF